MDIIWQGLVQAVELLVGGDAQVWGIVGLSLLVSGTATAISTALGVPLGLALALGRFPARTGVISVVNSGMGLPPVVVGLGLSLLLWRTGPLGGLHLLYTPGAMVLAQVLLALPLVAGLTLAAVQQLDPRLRLQILALGATRGQLARLLLREIRGPLLGAVMAGFGAVISEVGASLMVGGNILGETRVLTTATVLATGRGEFDVAIALSTILLGLTFLVAGGLTWLQQRGPHLDE
ncbi:MAG TPA: ABC transporter permease [Chloroflexia bacterium]|nr:ABC transporter permease [Chloroflexia bacterium]